MAVSLLNSQNPTFDRVQVSLDGASTSYSYVEFMGLPLALRIRLILAGQPNFLLGESVVPKKAALSLG